VSIRASNNRADVNNSVDITVECEFVGYRFVRLLSQTLRIPDRAQNQFHCIFAYAGDDIEGFSVVPYGQAPTLPPGADSYRFVSAWGTEPHKTSLAQQQQDNAVVQFVGDYAYDLDYGVKVNGDGLWHYRGNHGGWPPAYTRAIRLRGEAGLKNGTTQKLGQINFASSCVEGTRSRGDMSFATQVKGPSSPGNCDTSQDWVRVVVDPAINALAVMINDQSLGLYLNSGYELAL
jgi:hypothetical protein